MKKNRKYSLLKLYEQTSRNTTQSVDSVIDSILLGYKKDSLAEGRLDRFFSLLLEEPEEGSEDEEESQEDSSQTVGDEQQASDQPMPAKIPKIDIDSYSEKVMNLFENYQNLIDIRSIIIQRAIKILFEAGYNQNTIQGFQDILQNEFGISVENGVAADKDEIPSAPPATGAGAEI